jgi:hypothetical protein
MGMQNKLKMVGSNETRARRFTPTELLIHLIELIFCQWTKYQLDQAIVALDETH